MCNPVPNTRTEEFYTDLTIGLNYFNCLTRIPNHGNINAKYGNPENRSVVFLYQNTSLFKGNIRTIPTLQMKNLWGLVVVALQPCKTNGANSKWVRTNYSVKYHFAPNLFKIGVRCFSGGKIAEKANALVNPRDIETQSLIRNGEIKQLNSVMLKKASQVCAFSTTYYGKLNRSLDPVYDPPLSGGKQSNLDLTNKVE